MAIYTKRGDRGETSLFDKDSSQRTRISKDSPKVGAIGGIDELNSYLGITSALADAELLEEIREIQGNLFTIGSILAGAKLRFGKGKTRSLEKKIDKIEDKLPPLSGFIFPGGSQVASHLQYARALCRRVERSLVGLEFGKWKLEILAYVNRLSDYLFMLARKANFDAKVREEHWKRK